LIIFLNLRFSVCRR
jgi:hypothetical protein